MKRTLALICTAIVAALLILAPQATAPEAVRTVLEHARWTPEQRAADWGITIVWTETPCGHPDTEWGGCFDSSDPYTVQIASYGEGPNDHTSYDEYAVLHELSHVRQWQYGLPMTECGADENAARWGALVSGYDCPGLVSQEDFER